MSELNDFTRMPKRFDETTDTNELNRLLCMTWKIPQELVSLFSAMGDTNCRNQIRDKVQTLIENCSPNKTETTALKMKIILSDEKPIAQRSHRLSLPEKREVEKPIDECSDYFQRYINYVFRELLRDGTLIIYLDDIIIPATDEKEANKKVARVLEIDENVRNIKKLLPSNKTTEFILNDNDLFKISEKQELLVVPEMMQVNVIKKVHSFRHFAMTKTEKLIGQQEDARGEWENLPPKTKKKLNIRRRVGNNREDSLWKQDEAMDFALMREE
ncbi:hypothetical protein TNCV_3605941 [Trichonephila clavipes]|uniref:Reverse transcriptase domain-containing protein n=1 Tax=Trichonephila clavipes TaxID=2585209 RepID=A0A8X6RIB8_TRICX|nr:hypothetical protein TNCV_3605941 [Trichonephila clavipes]